MSDRKDDGSKLNKDKISDQKASLESDNSAEQASDGKESTKPEQSDDSTQQKKANNKSVASDKNKPDDKSPESDKEVEPEKQVNETEKNQKNQSSSPEYDKAISDLEASLAKTKKETQSTAKEEKETASKPTSDEPIKDTKAASYSPPKERPESKSTAPKTKALWFFTVLNFFLLIGVGAAGFWFWQQMQMAESEQENTIASLESRIAGSGEATRDLSSETKELRDNQAALTSSIDNLLAEILSGNETDEALQKRLAELSGRRPSDWLLAEADYLVNMAGRKLYLENDVKTATTLLAEADSRLEDLNDPALFPVRTLIAADIAALNQVNNVSETSVALAIGGLIPQASTLPLRTLKLPEPPVAAETTPSSDISEWRENLSRVWNDLTDDLVNKTPIDGPIAPYLSESQQWLIEQQLKYALSRAQTAALAQQTKVFEQNLLEAVALIDEHYELEEASVRQFLGALENLLNTDFSKDYPERLQTQQALKDILEQRVNALFNNGGNTL